METKNVNAFWIVIGLVALIVCGGLALGRDSNPVCLDPKALSSAVTIKLSEAGIDWWVYRNNDHLTQEMLDKQRNNIDRLRIWANRLPSGCERDEYLRSLGIAEDMLDAAKEEFRTHAFADHWREVFDRIDKENRASEEAKAKIVSPPSQ